jgi:hypothetical protein
MRIETSVTKARARIAPQGVRKFFSSRSTISRSADAGAPIGRLSRRNPDNSILPDIPVWNRRKEPEAAISSTAVCDGHHLCRQEKIEIGFAGESTMNAPATFPVTIRNVLTAEIRPNLLQQRSIRNSAACCAFGATWSGRVYSSE